MYFHDIEQLADPNHTDTEQRITSKYRGLYYDKKHNAWRVRIFYLEKQRHIGRFKDETMAAQAYDRAAYFLYGTRANLNFRLKDVLADPLDVPASIRQAREQPTALHTARFHSATAGSSSSSSSCSPHNSVQSLQLVAQLPGHVALSVMGSATAAGHPDADQSFQALQLQQVLSLASQPYVQQQQQQQVPLQCVSGAVLSYSSSGPNILPLLQGPAQLTPPAELASAAAQAHSAQLQQAALALSSHEHQQQLLLRHAAGVAPDVMDALGLPPQAHSLPMSSCGVASAGSSFSSSVSTTSSVWPSSLLGACPAATAATGAACLPAAAGPCLQRGGSDASTSALLSMHVSAATGPATMPEQAGLAGQHLGPAYWQAAAAAGLQPPLQRAAPVHTWPQQQQQQQQQQLLPQQLSVNLTPRQVIASAAQTIHSLPQPSQGLLCSQPQAAGLLPQFAPAAQQQQQQLGPVNYQVGQQHWQAVLEAAQGVPGAFGGLDENAVCVQQGLQTSLGMPNSLALHLHQLRLSGGDCRQ